MSLLHPTTDGRLPAGVPAIGVCEERSERVWLFDLDNTLHDASAHIFPHINRAMTAYIERHLAVSTAEANRLRMDYWQRYGATLLGLIRHHGTDPRHFLWETHQFPDLAGMARWHHALQATLKRLPGRKLIFSNAPSHYTHALLRLTGIGPLFDAVYPVERLRFRPKPLHAGFRQLLVQERLDPRRCVMVEDSLANLVTAKKLGMKTVWLTPGLRRSAWVDVQARSVIELPGRLRELR
jgi:putative hydrolase of the HAD superfamily